MIRTTFLDCEFDPRDMSLAGLLSLGVTDADGRDYYAINADANLSGLLDHAFIVEHVLPHLPVTAYRGSTVASRTGAHGFLRRWWRRLRRSDRLTAIEWDTNHPHYQYVRPAMQIAADLEQYFHAPAAPELIAYYGAQDICRLHSLWNNDWSAMPAYIPRYFTDLKVLADQLGVSELPEQQSTAHHALDDARYNREAHDYLLRHKAQRLVLTDDLARQLHRNDPAMGGAWEDLTCWQRADYRAAARKLLAQYDIRVRREEP
ncbi:hypothetical protein WKI65_43160 [Streptomyces sp. MS1.AVA.3]|uniref:hypothetical protein n=1 Tax=Streptomyces decoyicus TaxID=249567 RepID=UPI0030C55E03